MVPPVGAVHDREWFAADQNALSSKIAKTNEFNPALTKTRTPIARWGVLKRAIPIWVLVEVHLKSLVFAIFGDNTQCPWDVHSRGLKIQRVPAEVRSVRKTGPAPTLVLFVEVVFQNIFAIEEVVCEPRV